MDPDYPVSVVAPRDLAFGKSRLGELARSAVHTLNSTSTLVSSAPATVEASVYHPPLVSAVVPPVVAAPYLVWFLPSCPPVRRCPASTGPSRSCVTGWKTVPACLPQSSTFTHTSPLPWDLLSMVMAARWTRRLSVGQSWRSWSSCWWCVDSSSGGGIRISGPGSRGGCEGPSSSWPFLSPTSYTVWGTSPTSLVHQARLVNKMFPWISYYF
jgi:hypothetical protein